MDNDDSQINQYPVDPLLNQAVQWQESRDNPDAVSPKGAVGSMGTMLSTLKNPGYGVTPAKDDSEAERKRVGNDYLQAMHNKYQDKNLALAAYNWGPGNVDNWIANGQKPADMPVETKNYVQNVNQIHQQLQSKQLPVGVKMASNDAYSSDAAPADSTDPFDIVAKEIANKQAPSKSSATPAGTTPSTQDSTDPFDIVAKEIAQKKDTAQPPAQVSDNGTVSNIGAGIIHGALPVVNRVMHGYNWLADKVASIEGQSPSPHPLEMAGNALQTAIEPAYQSIAKDAPIATGVGNVGGQVLATAPLLGAAGEGAGVVANALSDVPYVGTAAKFLTGGIESNAETNALGQTIQPATWGNRIARFASSVPVGAAGGAGANTLIGASPTQGAEIGAVAGPVLSLAGSGLNALFSKGEGSLSPAENKLQQALIRDGYVTPEGHVDTAAVQNKLTQLGANATLADVGPNTRDLAGAVAQAPGAGKDIVSSALEERQAGQVDRITQAVTKGLNVDPDATAQEAIDTLDAQRKVASKPAYDKAFEGGSIAPLEKQFEGSFADAAQNTTAVTKELNEANNALTIAKAKQTQTGGNVYADNVANQAVRDAENAVSAAQNKLDAANSNEQDVKDLLKQAQSDRANGVKGAVWNPRIQQFINDPDVKSGISRGLRIQRLEALANGEKFDPTEYGITGEDANGNPIVSKVPNMRLLNAAKKGLDAQISDNTDKVTGKVNELGRALTMTKNSFVKELTNVNPDYADALKSYSDPSQSINAVNAGKNFIKSGAAGNGKALAKISDTDKPFFRIGVAQKISDILQNTPDGADAVKRIFNTPAKRDALQSVFPSKQAFDDFANEAQSESAFYKTKSGIGGNSFTNARVQASEDLGTPLQQKANKVAELANLGWQFGQRNAMGKLAYAGQLGLNKLNAPPPALTAKDSEELANLLVSPQGGKTASVAFKPVARSPELQNYMNILHGAGTAALLGNQLR